MHEPSSATNTTKRHDAAISRANALAHALDTAFRIPGTPIRFGWDAVLGLVPVLGDSVGAVLGAYPILEGRRLGIRKRALSKMIWRLVLDWLLGLVPLLDLVLDVGYKANKRNAEHLARELELMSETDS